METETKPKAEKTSKSAKLAVIRVRNTTQASGAIRDTLDMLLLRRKFTCVVINNTPAMNGMILKVKDFVTFGEITDETQKELESKRGKKDKDGKLTNHFHLHPPRGGFERKGIKKAFTQGGSLGYRGEKINDLIKRML